MIVAVGHQVVGWAGEARTASVPGERRLLYYITLRHNMGCTHVRVAQAGLRVLDGPGC